MLSRIKSFFPTPIDTSYPVCGPLSTAFDTLQPDNRIHLHHHLKKTLFRSYLESLSTSPRRSDSGRIALRRPGCTTPVSPDDIA